MFLQQLCCILYLVNQSIQNDKCIREPVCLVDMHFKSYCTFWWLKKWSFSVLLVCDRAHTFQNSNHHNKNFFHPFLYFPCLLFSPWTPTLKSISINWSFYHVVLLQRDRHQIRTIQLYVSLIHPNKKKGLVNKIGPFKWQHRLPCLHF